MKNKIWLLTKTQLLDQFGFSGLKYEKDAKKKRRIIAFSVGMMFVCVLFAVYSFGIGYGFYQIGLLQLIPGFAFTLTGACTLFFTMFWAGGMLFDFRDYDMLMALPVPTSHVIASRFFLMYGFNLLLSAVVMLPMGIIYGIFNHAWAAFYPMWFVITIVTPLIPMVIASLIGVLIHFVSSRFRHTNAIGMILSCLAVVAVLVACLSLGTLNVNSISEKQLSSLGTLFAQKEHQLNPLAGIIEQAVGQYDLIAFLGFLILSGLVFYLFLAIVSTRYKAIHTALTAFTAKSDYQLHEIETNSPFKALYHKELKRFFSSTIYVVNLGIGALLLLVFSFASAFFGIDRIRQMSQISFTASIEGIVPLIISIFLGMTCTTSVSLSLEGKNFWILQTSPVKAETVYQSKMAVNLTILLPAALISSLLMSLSLKTGLLLTFWMFVTPLAYAVFTPVWGIFINQKLPNFAWESEVTVIKQGMASMVGILGGMLFGIIPIVFLVLLKNVDQNIILAVTTVLVVLFATLLYKKVCKVKLASIINE